VKIGKRGRKGSDLRTPLVEVAVGQVVLIQGGGEVGERLVLNLSIHGVPCKG
jgi:hypothetical protein